MACDHLNTTIQVRCMEDDGKEHSDHWALTGASLAMVYWPNESYVAPLAPEPKKKWAPRHARKHSTEQYLNVVNTATQNARVEATPAEDLHRVDDPSTRLGILDDDAEPISPTYLCNGVSPKKSCSSCGCTCYMCERGHNHGTPFVVFGHQSSCETRRRR